VLITNKRDRISITVNRVLTLDGIYKVLLNGGFLHKPKLALNLLLSTALLIVSSGSNNRDK
jgi:hypothetical protein